MTVVVESATAAWTALTSHLNQWFYQPDIEALACVLAAVRAHYGDDEPVWLFVIGPSGSGKTAIAANCAAGFPLAHLEGDINMRAMMNCQRGGENLSVLDGEKGYGKSFILVFKDFTSIISKKDEDQKELLGLFRELYDGAYERKTAGRWGSWKGKATILACTTPAIERAWAAYRALGERFLQVRWPNSDPIQIARRARAQRGLEKSIAHEMRELSHDLFRATSTHPAPSLTEAQGFQIDSLASMIAKLRQHVTRDSHGDRSVIEVSAAEEPTRIAKCLETLACHHALLWGRDHVEQADLRIAVRVGFDSIPHNRSKIIRSIPSDAPMPVVDIRKMTSMVRSTIFWVGDELVAMNILEQIGSMEDEISYRFTPEFAEMWRNSNLPPCVEV